MTEDCGATRRLATPCPRTAVEMSADPGQTHRFPRRPIVIDSLFETASTPGRTRDCAYHAVVRPLIHPRAETQNHQSIILQ
jgi:hypothetical protein